ncbi:hypothetical protein LEI94_22825 [Salmonella enterica]|uniref:hypothetical protein n=1 Tax=Salmonella sp. SAL04162 TaxID=3159782 RepID=UPI002A223CFF|nr:hypothetical protein [Salmonella enterica]MDJ6367192.1 hypothetical protein [Salmonella enterica]
MKAYFDDNASLCIDAENSAEKAALLLWFGVNADSVHGKATFESVVDANDKGLLLMINGVSIFSTSENAIDGNANCNAASVTKSASE